MIRLVAVDVVGRTRLPLAVESVIQRDVFGGDAYSSR